MLLIKIETLNSCLNQEVPNCEIARQGMHNNRSQRTPLMSQEPCRIERVNLRTPSIQLTVTFMRYTAPGNNKTI